MKQEVEDWLDGVSRGTEAFVGWLLYWGICLAILGAAAYGVVRFVHWAWYR